MKKLETLINSNQKLLIPYITPDFPFKGVTEKLVHELEKIGIKAIELGIPYSDPLADGPTIQQSSLVAIANGVNVKRVLELAGYVSKNTNIAVILMGYTNQMLQYGIDKFFSEAKLSGVQGVIVPDMPQDESNLFRQSALNNEIALIYLVAPTSKPERIQLISERSSLFSYCVSMNGVTGKDGIDFDSLKEIIARVSQFHSKPFVIGFGLSTPKDIQFVFKIAKGAVVGSALIRALEKGKTIDESVKSGIEFLKPLSEVTVEQ